MRHRFAIKSDKPKLYLHISVRAYFRKYLMTFRNARIRLKRAIFVAFSILARRDEMDDSRWGKVVFQRVF